MAVPLLGMGCVQWLGVNDDLARVAVLLLAAPMAANVVVIANQLDVHPEIAASTSDGKHPAGGGCQCL